MSTEEERPLVKWQYCVAFISWFAQLDQDVERQHLGNLRFELVTIVDDGGSKKWIFKRPVP